MFSIKKSNATLANGNKLTKRKCVICGDYMRAKKQLYCQSACSRIAEKKLAKIRRLKI